MPEIGSRDFCTAMNIILQLAAYLPQMLITNQLARLTEQATAALDALLDDHAPDALPALRRERTAAGGLDARQLALVSAVSARLTALTRALGEEEAVQLAYRALFKVGAHLGEEMRKLFAVGELPEDLPVAANVFFRLFGARVHAEALDEEGKVCWQIERCALAPHCNQAVCHVLSGIEEGLVQGLNPWVAMTITAYRSDGAATCTAELTHLPRRGAEKRLLPSETEVSA